MPIIFENILIYGVGETKVEAIENHHQRLITLLERCKSKGLHLSEVSFMGHVISEEGLKPDPAKIQGVQESKQDVKRPLGTVNYLQKFAPSLSEATAPFRELLKEENPTVGKDNCGPVPVEWKRLHGHRRLLLELL